MFRPLFVPRALLVDGLTLNLRPRLVTKAQAAKHRLNGVRAHDEMARAAMGPRLTDRLLGLRNCVVAPVEISLRRME